MHKRCSKCGETKPVSDFGRRKASKDGLQIWCKKCTNGYARKWGRENADHVSKTHRAYYRANREKWVEDRETYRERHPDKISARNTVNNALYRGEIAKPDSCEDCGRLTESRRLHAHHDDYSKPLEVKWKCLRCHWDEHRQ